MQQLYLKRLTKQDITRSVAICTESVKSFWDCNPEAIEEYMPIFVCHEDDPNYFPDGITIHKGYNGEKDWRICGNEWKKLYADDNPDVADIMIVRKLSYKRFSVSITKKQTSQHKLLSSFFSGSDNYALLTIDDIRESTSHEEGNHNESINNLFRPFITAIKSKPFLLLAGISGTGKSRIVRELARACWEEGSEEYEAQKPRNFEMVQVKPNWHDSSELIGYMSRISGQTEYVVGDFLRFIVKAWQEKDVPYFLCLDEMNLAPVEQYFAEYLSVIETRKNKEGNVVTDPILPAAKMGGPNGTQIPQRWYSILINELLSICPNKKVEELREQFTSDGICLPPNLVVIGTVNMDETTFSFSRKVLDRAMTIEMNKVDLTEGLTERHEQIGKLGAAELIGTAVEGVDVYGKYKEVCDTAISYLQKVNEKLEGTPFKIAYRTRNEVLLYVVNNLPYNKDAAGKVIPQQDVINMALDEITSMKILSRIEGDSDKIGSLLDDLKKVIEEQLGEQYDKEKSVSLKKLDEMNKRLASGYTSFWS